MEKIVFVVFFVGEWVKMKVVKICEVFGVNWYFFFEDLNR